MLQFDSLKNIPHLRHAITTRGGHCNGPYDALNLAYHAGDDAARVTENRKKVAEELGYNAARLVTAQQVHSRWNVRVGSGLVGYGAFDWESALHARDALIVKDAQIPVLIQVADCAPLLLVDEKNHVFAAVHAGWRGASSRVTSTAAVRMELDWFTDFTQLCAGIGPCLCLECFEIGPEVVEAAQKIAPEAVIQRSEWQKPHLDLRLLIQRDLEDIGVPRENIEIMPNCPKCENEIFFSHRGQNGKAGRFGLIAWWEA